MVQPTIRANANFSMITIEWVPPVIPNGNIDYYEVKTQFIKSGRIDKETVIKSRQKSCVLHSTCQNVTGYYTFAVRAINYVASPHSNPHHIKVNVSIYNEESKIISDTKHLTQRCDENDTDLLEILSLDPFAQNLKSNWSSQAMHSCQYAYTRSSEFLFFSILLMVMSFVIAAVVFMFYKKIKNMKDILVQMPPGLEDLTSDTKKGKNDGGLSLGVENKINKPDILSQIEEESLLKRSSNSSLHSGGESYSQGSSQKSHNNSSQSDGHSSTGSRCSDDDYEYDAFKHSQLINDDRSSTNNAYKVLPVLEYYCYNNNIILML